MDADMKDLSSVLKNSVDLYIKGIDKDDKKHDHSSAALAEPVNFITPGKVITREIGFMRDSITRGSSDSETDALHEVTVPSIPIPMASGISMEHLESIGRGNVRMEDPVKSIDDIPDHILEEIFNYLPTKPDLLKNTRLVSQKWHTIGTPICRRRFVTLSLKAIPQLDNVFMTTFAKPLSVPWSSVTFTMSTYSLPSPTRYEEWMLEDFGAHLWRLNSDYQLWDDLLHFLQFTPNLRTLVLTSWDGLFPRIIPATLNLPFLKYLKITITPHTTSFLRFLIHKCDVRLKKLKLKVPLDTVNVETAKRLMSIIKPISYFVPTICLKIIFRTEQVQEVDVISIIADGNLKLRKLNIRFHEPRPNESFLAAFGQMLTASSKSLRSLKMDYYMERRNRTAAFKFPILSALKSLKIIFDEETAPFAEETRHEFTRYPFSDAETKKFPVLEKVAMKSFVGEVAGVFKAESCRWDTVTEVEYKCGEEYSSVADLPQLFPNMKKLIADVMHEKSLVNIMRFMKNLEHLELCCFGSPNLNAILSGIPNVDEVYKKNPKLQLRIAKERALAGRPSLLSFTRLKTLVVDCGFCDDGLELLDSGAYLAILPLEPLELLELSCVDISAECEEKLSKRHQVVKIQTVQRNKAAVERQSRVADIPEFN